MSDSIGMKVANRVDEADRLPFLQALAHIATADDTVTLDEKQMVEEYTEAWELNESDQRRVQEVLDSDTTLSLDNLVAEFTESGTRFFLVQELMRLAHADGTYGNAERKQIAGIAQRMDMNEDQFREVEKWVNRRQAWEGGDEEESEDERGLQDVLGGDDDDDDEYDLSDIDTAGESSLDEINPGGYEIDEEEFEEEADEETPEEDGEVAEQANSEDKSD